jgi:hypothetical protein
MQLEDSILVKIGTEIKVGRIVGISVAIENDLENAVYDASLCDGAMDEVSADGDEVLLARKAGGFFDDPQFKELDTNRGRVIICYTT